MTVLSDEHLHFCTDLKLLSVVETNSLTKKKSPLNYSFLRTLLEETGGR